jgi:hypothetical protein
MIRARYSDFQDQMARVAGTTGMSPTDPRVMDQTNLAIQELMDEADWPSLVARLQFNITKPRIVVPSDFDRILYLTINRTPLPMQSPWYEFIGDGPDYLDSPYGVPPSDSSAQALINRFVGVLDREQMATFEDVPQDGNTYLPTIYGTANELTAGNPNRPVLVLQGYDNNNNWIRTISASSGTWIDGMELPINGDTPPYASQGTIPISQVTAITKPVTNGYVNLYATNGSNNVFLGSYAPQDTVPYYRSYRIPGLNEGTKYQVVARLRRRFRPIVSPADFLLITNLPALVTMLQAIYYREAKDLQNYTAYKQTAVDILRKEAKAYIGLQRQKPAISFGEGLGVRRDGLYIL